MRFKAGFYLYSRSLRHGNILQFLYLKQIHLNKTTLGANQLWNVEDTFFYGIGHSNAYSSEYETISTTQVVVWMQIELFTNDSQRQHVYSIPTEFVNLRDKVVHAYNKFIAIDLYASINRCLWIVNHWERTTFCWRCTVALKQKNVYQAQICRIRQSD